MSSLENRKSHVLLEINKETDWASLDKNLFLPPRLFPPHFKVKKDKFLCCGYFISYNTKLTPDQVAQYCQKSSWSYLASIIGDFLIFYFDFKERSIHILTDQFGKFPLFFQKDSKHLILSTSFKLVKDSTNSPLLNYDTAFDFISRVTLLTDNTLISQIKQVPPATLLKINNNFSLSLTPLQDPRDFLSVDPPKYKSLPEFSFDFLNMFSKIISERLAAIEKLSFGSDLSSGFDSSLLSYILKQNSHKDFYCYCGISKYTTEDTDPKIVKEFAQKNNLKVRFIKEDSMFPFSSKEDIYWEKTSPGQIAQGLMYNFYKHIINDTNNIEFIGEGGDEVYKSPETNLLGFFPIQEEYFWIVKRLNLGIKNIFTKKGINYLLDQRRFQNKKVFPSIAASSAILVNLELFPLLWKLKLWTITPFMDPRLIQIARGIPRNTEQFSKQKIWKVHNEIFIPSQFKPKKGPTGLMRLFIIRNKKILIQILEKSLLAQSNFVKADDIVKDMKENNLEKYFEGDTASFLLNLIKIEYFLQENNINP